MAGRQWGWHQLAPSWAERLVADAAIPRGALVLDIGAGDGALTRPLLTAGARVVAIEAHPLRAAALRHRFGSDVVVVHTDAADLRLPKAPFYVVANPPFSISAALLHRLLHRGSRLVEGHLVLQSQVTRRWAAGAAPGARRWSVDFALRAARPIPRHAFSPPPAVDTRVLAIERRRGR